MMCSLACFLGSDKQPPRGFSSACSFQPDSSVTHHYILLKAAQATVTFMLLIRTCVYVYACVWLLLRGLLLCIYMNVYAYVMSCLCTIPSLIKFLGSHLCWHSSLVLFCSEWFDLLFIFLAIESHNLSALFPFTFTSQCSGGISEYWHMHFEGLKYHYTMLISCLLLLTFWEKNCIPPSS